MLSPSVVKKESGPFFIDEKEPASSPELRFISDLGRSLLFTVHPKKVATRVAEALLSGVGAEVCAFVAELDNIGLVNCAFDTEGEKLTDILNKSNFDKWIELLPPQIAYAEEEKEEFLLSGSRHEMEYISPLHINGEIKGAIIVGFAKAAGLTETRSRLIDAATQMAAMSVNLSAHYEAAINNSIFQTKEEHRKFTEAILDALPVSLYVIDRDYKIVTWNRHREVGVQGIPREAAIGRNIFEVLARYPQDKSRQEFERAFTSGRIERLEQQTVDDDGSARHWVISKVPMHNAETGDVTHVITVGEDVTVRVEAIHAVGRAEKLAAVGRLAAGVVHEINNPLATISACAEALQQRVEEGDFPSSPAVDDLNEYLGLIKSEAFRCKSITNGLLDFSRIRQGARHTLDVSEILKSSAKLISHQKRGDKIDIEIDIKSEMPLIHADGGHVQQAVIALAANAVDAMPDGGTLILRCFTQGTRVVIEVADTGVGIAPENMPKIFEPFFTTKETGKGTGLGLAVSYGIITEHGGRISVRSNVGKGTVFSIFLPAAN